jgi:hypothetical protein
VKPPVIHLKDIQTVWVSLRKFIQEPLIAIGVYVRELEKKRGTRDRFNRSIEPEGFEQPLP